MKQKGQSYHNYMFNFGSPIKKRKSEVVDPIDFFASKKKSFKDGDYIVESKDADTIHISDAESDDDTPIRLKRVKKRSIVGIDEDEQEQEDQVFKKTKKKEFTPKKIQNKDDIDDKETKGVKA